MLVKDQLRIRMEQHSMSVTTLAERLNVSGQTVRHWLNGRSFPGKSKTPELEAVLSFKLDYGEGAAPRAETVEASLQKSDVETFLLISRLPPEVKTIFGRLARAFDQYTRPPEISQARAQTGSLDSGPPHQRRRRKTTTAPKR